LMLVALEGFPVDSAARLLDLPPSEAQQRLRSARRRLRRVPVQPSRRSSNARIEGGIGSRAIAS
jgi:DNA-directed RNA polymerase specialized sigma24 family protein